EKMTALGEELAEEYPDQAQAIREECRYLSTLAHNLVTSLQTFDSIHESLGKALKGRFCIIGQTDAGTTDIGVNPFHNEYVNVGTHAVVLDTIISESFITWLSPWWRALFCLITPLVIFASAGLAPGLRSSLGICSAGLALFLSFILFRFTGIFLGPLCPVLSLLIAAALREIIAYMVSDREKQFIRRALSTYTSPAVADVLIKNPSLFTLGGDKRVMTAIFTDIRSFSTISQALRDPATGDIDPARLVSLLNVYLTRMSDIVLDNQGTIDKYEGDAIIAFFGAPVPTEEHALFACRSAIAMKKAEADFNREAREKGLIDQPVLEALAEKKILKDVNDPIPILTRFGINTGSMVVGNMGTQNKMNYTIMGNAVNLAARLEGVNKQYGTQILASGETLAAAQGKIFARQLDRVRVVGITDPVSLWELIDEEETATENDRKRVSVFNDAMRIFEARDWTAAEAAFRKTLEDFPDDGPAKNFMARSAKYRASPPPADWDGIFNLVEK
ncbi:MAG: CHASE2 domain-containing protein, partial [Spirochaetaceae bacterium]|nr:CHASE2 domain-containing protein [Spirochaetaceae bacterium]